MPDALLIVILVLLAYVPLCLLIALVRALFAGRQRRASAFRETFWHFFLELLNPLNWF